MLDDSREHVPFFRMRDQRAVKRGVIALRAATGEDDLPRISMDQSGHFCACFLNMLRHLVTERIRTRGVAPEFAEERKHRREHFRSDPSGRVVVKIVNRLLAHTVSSQSSNMAGRSPKLQPNGTETRLVRES